MNQMAEQYAALAKQVFPRAYKDSQSTEEIATICMCTVFCKDGIELPAMFYGADVGYGDSVAVIEKAKEQGYVPIVNDGKLLGFQKENTL